MMKPIDLYVVPPSPPCRAVIAAAKFMKVTVNLVYVDLMKGEQKEDWFVKLNPQHCLPTINDNGFILWESRAIMAYFANRYAPNNEVYPRDAKHRAIVDRLMQYDLNVLYRSLGDFLIPIVRQGKMVTQMLNPVKEKKVTEALSYIEAILSVHNFVAGDHLTLADFSIYHSLEFAQEFKYDLSRYTLIWQWFKRTQTLIHQINQYTDNIAAVVNSVNSYQFDNLNCLIIKSNQAQMNSNHLDGVEIQPCRRETEESQNNRELNQLQRTVNDQLLMDMFSMRTDPNQTRSTANSTPTSNGSSHDHCTNSNSPTSSVSPVPNGLDQNNHHQYYYNNVQL